ncbi:hypothetical protein WMY93_003413 [Mugilogobius chulae]|uniref:Uncharacterized protein n=1 Tax=Mugilogobius chulae TaxID=88201 RepID=A0AAW0Q6E0_9GOBI
MRSCSNLTSPPTLIKYRRQLLHALGDSLTTVPPGGINGTERRWQHIKLSRIDSRDIEHDDPKPFLDLLSTIHQRKRIQNLLATDELQPGSPSAYTAIHRESTQHDSNTMRVSVITYTPAGGHTPSMHTELSKRKR